MYTFIVPGVSKIKEVKKVKGKKMKDKKENKVKTAFIVTTAILVLMSMLPVMASAQTTGEINIKEIMYNPSTEQGRDTNMEWLELYNNDTVPINISGWTMDDKLISDKIMQPGDYVVLARNKTAFEAYYGTLPCSVIDVTFVLANSGDTVVLKNSTGIEIDNVTYINNWGANGNNKTLERNATGGWEESRVDGGTPCRRNSVLGIPLQVTNASANPPVIAVNTDITELRVDAAGIESPIDVVTVDISPIGGNASTVMFNIGNYTKNNILWTMYNYTTNASVKGTFNLTVNATDINGNYNDTVNITLDVKKAVIPFSMITPGTTYIMNITYDVIPPNVGQNATIDLFSGTAVIDGETYFVVNETKPIGGTKFYTGANFTTEDSTLKRLVSEGVSGEVANLTFDPACVLLDYPLWVGKTWNTTTNVTGRLVDAATGAEIPIATSAVVTGNVTREEYLTVPYGTNIHCLVAEINVSLQNPPMSFLIRQWWSNHEMALMPKYQNYVSGNLMQELELIGIVAP